MKRIVFGVFVTVASVFSVVAEETVAADAKPGFWAREWKATKRICLSPVPIVKGTWNTCKDLTVGLAELLTGCSFGDDVRKDADRDVTAAPATAPDPVPEAEAEQNGEDALYAACERGDWKTAVTLGRNAFARRSNDGPTKAVMGTRLAMLCWNDGDRLGSIVTMDATVALCSRLDPAKEQAAARFRNDLRKKPASEAFSVAEIKGAADVLR